MAVDPVTIGVKLALTAISYAMAPKIEGPRLKTLEVTTADYGTPYPEVDGYCRIDGCPIGWAEPLREKKVDSKSKGGKQTNYKYFGTWWTIAAGHEVDGIPRIWMDRHLVYDLTQVGPISIASGFFEGLSGSPIKLSTGRNMRIYLGTETQLIDPRYEEWCEDRYGPDSATARRGTAGAIFEEIPLEKFGNRIPQISMAVVNDPDPAYLHQTFTPSGASGPSFSKDGTRALFYDTSDTDYAIWDVPTQTKLIDGEIPLGDVEEAAYAGNGGIWVVRGTLGDTLALLSADGTSVISQVSTGTNTDTLVAVGDNAYLRPFAGAGTSIIQCTSAGCNIINVDFTPQWYFGDLEGDHWAVGFDGADTRLYNITGAGDFTPAVGGVTGHRSAFANADGNIFLVVDTWAFIIDITDGSVIDSVDMGGAAQEHRDVARRMMAGSSRFYTKTKEIDTSTLETLQTYSMSSWTASNADAIAYEPITHSIWGRTSGTGTVTIRYLDRISANGVTLGSIVEAKSLRRGIPADAIDVTELTQSVLGYWTIQGSGAEQIGPLLDIHDVDATQHDYGLYFRNRGDAADALIDSSEFHANDGRRFDLSMVPESRIPARVEFNYADNTADQQPNTASDSVPLDAVAAQNKKVFDLTTYVDVPDGAQPKVNRYLRRQWFERELGEATLDITYGRLEPGDVKTIDVDGEQRSVRFTELTRSGLLVQAKWVRDDPRVHDTTAQAGPTFDGREDDVIYVTTPTKAVVMDIPFLNDEEADDRPLLHYGAGNYGGGNWPGAIIWDGDFASGNYEQWNAVDSADRAVWGYTESALGEADPWCWDRGNIIVIQLKGGTLTNATEAEINADPSINQAVIGAQGRWETVNFTTATLLGSDRWEISGFKRGRRGTEWAIPDHAAGDEFWLASNLARDSFGLSSVGLSEDYKGQTLGRDPVGSPAIDVVLEGQTLKPYAPANLSAVRNFTTGAWEITGTRRTRIGGAWVGGTPIPLSEAIEEYEVIILDGTEEKRPLTVTFDGDGNFSATYSGSDQATDFGSVQANISVVAYQISDAVGRGFPATINATETGDVLPSTITAGSSVAAANAGVTPINTPHATGDTLLCVVICRGAAISAACATAGWTDADGITNPTAMNNSRMWLFQNECDSNSEANPEITVSGGGGSDTVTAVVIRIPSRNTAANFILGTVSANGSNNTSIRWAQDSPSIDDGNAILAIGCKNNSPISGSNLSNISAITAGLDWTKIVRFETTQGGDMSISIDYAINDSGSAYTAGTGGVVTAAYSVGTVSAGVYLEVPLL